MNRDNFSYPSLKSDWNSAFKLHNNSWNENLEQTIDDPYDQYIAEVIESNILRKIQSVLEKPQVRCAITQTEEKEVKIEKGYHFKDFLLIKYFFYKILLFLCFCLIIKFFF